MSLPQSTKAWQSAHTVNAHGTVLSGNASDVSGVINTAAVTSPTVPLPGARPAFMLRGARQGDWAHPHLVFIYNQMVNYEGSYRI